MPAILAGHAHRVRFPLGITRYVNDTEAQSRSPRLNTDTTGFAAAESSAGSLQSKSAAETCNDRCGAAISCGCGRGPRLEATALVRSHSNVQVPACWHGLLCVTQRLSHLSNVPSRPRFYAATHRPVRRVRRTPREGITAIQRDGSVFSDRKSGLLKWMNCSIVTAVMPSVRSRADETFA
jgi:hypothetical protein